MKVFLLESKPGTRFHFGKALGAFTEETHNTQKTTSDYLHSDTLWSALVNAWALSCPESVDAFVTNCFNGNFKISSAFYCYIQPLQNGQSEKHKPVYFLPKPAILNLFDYPKPKELKKIRFISKGVWKNGLLPNDWFDDDKCVRLQNETAVALKSEISESFKLFSIETSAKTSARDITNREDVFYFQTDLYLSDNVQWYFFIENMLPENLQSDFQLVMQTFVNLGIGGERTTGCGSLSGFKELDFNFINIASDGRYNVSVSLVAPQENELSENALYQIIKRGGRFLEKGKSLPMVQMLLEGAVFDNDVKGKIIELNDEPKVLRYGLNFSIPLHSNFSNIKF